MGEYYDDIKTGVYKFGHVLNKDIYLDELREKTFQTLTKLELDNNIEQALKSNNVVFYEYGENGNVRITEEFNKGSTTHFAIGTSYFAKETNEELYACYMKKNSNWQGVKFYTLKQNYGRLNKYDIGPIVFKSFDKANEFVKKLHSKLLPGEDWAFSSVSVPKNKVHRPKTEYQILESYLKHVLKKLMSEYARVGSPNEGRIIFSENEEYALFNTGLLSVHAKDIFLVCKVHGEIGGRLLLNNPTVPDGFKDLETNYGFNEPDKDGKMPKMVTFFKSTDELIYDANKTVDFTEEKLSHIIKDGADNGRLPKRYEELCEKKEYSSVASALDRAIKDAETIAKRNFKYIIPQYRFIDEKTGRIQFLMPIYLDGGFNKQPDFALVLDLQGRYYIPETILPLSWAYNNARVICRPGDSWLKPAEIVDIVIDEDYE